MRKIEAEILIEAPPRRVFALSQDYGLRRQWDPFMRAMTYRDGERQAGKGVRVAGRAWNFMSMEVEYVSFQPPHSVAMKMTSGPWFFRQFAGVWLFKLAGRDRTRVIFRYAFETRWRFLRPLLDPLISWMFGRDVRGRLRGLKRGVEEMGLVAPQP